MEGFEERSRIVPSYPCNSSVPIDIPINTTLHLRAISLAFTGPFPSCELINLRKQHLDFSELGTPCQSCELNGRVSLCYPASGEAHGEHPEKSPLPWQLVT